MSACLESLLGPAVIAECALHEPPQQLFRVSADWPGGGFGYTLPFPSREAAHSWASLRARLHPGAVVCVEARS